MKKLTKQDKTFFLITIFVIILDQLTKFLVKHFMMFKQSVPLIKNIFHFTYTTNTGSAFSLFQNQTSLLIWFSIIVIGAILYNYDKIIKNKIMTYGFALILAGAIGNLIDRVFLRRVVDFIDFRVWPVFNIADSAAVIGVILLVIYLIKEK